MLSGVSRALQARGSAPEPSDRNGDAAPDLLARDCALCEEVEVYELTGEAAEVAIEAGNADRAEAPAEVRADEPTLA